MKELNEIFIVAWIVFGLYMLVFSLPWQIYVAG